MYYGNAKTKIAHYDKCHYAQQMRKSKSKTLRTFHTLEEARTQNYIICKCCDPVINPVRRMDKKAKKFCLEKSIKYEKVKDELLITTPYSEWIVHVDSDRQYNLFHRNTLGNTKKYHLHDKQYSNVISVFRYVYEHDKYRQANPLPKPKKKKKKKKLKPPKSRTRDCRAKTRRYKKQKMKLEAQEALKLIESLSYA